MKKETKGQKSRTGTNHFKHHEAALSWYREQDPSVTMSDILDKVLDKNISIGPPPIKEGQTLTVDPDGRYWIIE